MKSPFMIYAYFESILMPDTEGKQNPDESYRTNIKSISFAVMVID